MTPDDLDYVRGLTDAGLVAGPVLELGTGYGGPTCRELLHGYGVEHAGTDLREGEHVAFAADFEDPNSEPIRNRFGTYGTVLVLNVLEHTFQPLQVLDNAFRVVRPGGAVITSTPVIWPIHGFPKDCNRLLPDWFSTYAEIRSQVLLEEHFRYLGFGPVAAFRDANGQNRLPAPGRSSRHRFFSRVIHKVFNTTGRGVWAPSHVAVGVTYIRTT